MNLVALCLNSHIVAGDCVCRLFCFFRELVKLGTALCRGVAQGVDIFRTREQNRVNVCNSCRNFFDRRNGRRLVNSFFGYSVCEFGYLLRYLGGFLSVFGIFVSDRVYFCGCLIKALLFCLYVFINLFYRLCALVNLPLKRIFGVRSVADVFFKPFDGVEVVFNGVALNGDNGLSLRSLLLTVAAVLSYFVYLFVDILTCRNRAVYLVSYLFKLFACRLILRLGYVQLVLLLFEPFFRGFYRVQPKAYFKIFLILCEHKKFLRFFALNFERTHAAFKLREYIAQSDHVFLRLLKPAVRVRPAVAVVGNTCRLLEHLAPLTRF